MIEPYYQESSFKLYHADCHEILAEITANSVDMIFADPPYFLSGGTFTCQSGKKVSVKKADWDLGDGHKKNFLFHIEWIKACRRVLKPHGTIWVSGTYHSIYQCGFALQAAGFHILNDIAWFKPNASPNLSCRFFTASHETLIWARKEKKARHTFNYDEMVNWDNNYKKTYRCSKCGSYNSNEILHEKGKQMRSVFAINTPKKEEKKYGKHPTQKPLALLQRIIVASTNENDLIIDPFTGSSTTGLASFLHKRNFIGIDSDKNYLDLSIKRFEDLKRKVGRYGMRQFNITF